MSRAEYMREWRARRGARTGVTGRRPTETCGTPAAYRRHLRNNEPTCTACRAAWATLQRQLRAARSRHTSAQCETPAAN